MNFEAIKSVICLNLDFGSVLLNVLGIVGLIVVGALIITFIADWLIFIIDDKNGIFFKRKKQDDVEKLPERPKMLEQPAPEPTVTEEKEVVVEPTVDEQIEELSKNNKVDFEKARQEEEELKAKLALNNDGIIAEEETEEDDFDIEAAINKLKQQEQEYKEEKSKEIEERNNIIEEVQEQSNQEVEEPEDEEVDDDFDEEFKKIIEALNKNEEQDEADGIINNEEGVQLSMEEVQDNNVIEEQKPEEVQVEEEPVVEDAQEDFEAEKAALEEEIAKLRQELEDEREKLRQERVEAMEKAATLEGEKELLQQELEKAKQDNATLENAPLLSEQEYLDRLETLKERLKENEKQVRKNKKEFKPLERVKNTLERDKQKLRRREAIVAKQKVVLYGVNNFVDIDEEKAQKLAEDLDLLDGLRMSVQHCEEVMEANKDRYPILEQTYYILKQNNEQIKADIAETEEALRKIREAKEAEADVTVDAVEGTDNNTNNDTTTGSETITNTESNQ